LEISSEFGYNAILGRTPEKTGSSITYFKNEDLELVYNHINPWLVKENMSVICKEEFIKFLNAFSHRLRTRGGIDHPYLNNFRPLRKNGH
jgi:DEAD/DEAH box helicase domain-containing protein